MAAWEDAVQVIAKLQMKLVDNATHMFYAFTKDEIQSMIDTLSVAFGVKRAQANAAPAPAPAAAAAAQPAPRRPKAKRARKEEEEDDDGAAPAAARRPKGAPMSDEYIDLIKDGLKQGLFNHQIENQLNALRGGDRKFSSKDVSSYIELCTRMLGEEDPSWTRPKQKQRRRVTDNTVWTFDEVRAIYDYIPGSQGSFHSTLERINYRMTADELEAERKAIWDFLNKTENDEVNTPDAIELYIEAQKQRVLDRKRKMRKEQELRARQKKLMKQQEELEQAEGTTDDDELPARPAAAAAAGAAAADDDIPLKQAILMGKHHIGELRIAADKHPLKKGYLRWYRVYSHALPLDEDNEVQQADPAYYQVTVQVYEAEGVPSSVVMQFHGHLFRQWEQQNPGYKCLNSEPEVLQMSPDHVAFSEPRVTWGRPMQSISIDAPLPMDMRVKSRLQQAAPAAAAPAAAAAPQGVTARFTQLATPYLGSDAHDPFSTLDDAMLKQLIEQATKDGVDEEQTLEYASAYLRRTVAEVKPRFAVMQYAVNGDVGDGKFDATIEEMADNGASIDEITERVAAPDRSFIVHRIQCIAVDRGLVKTKFDSDTRERASDELARITENTTLAQLADIDDAEKRKAELAALAAEYGISVDEATLRMRVEHEERLQRENESAPRDARIRRLYAAGQLLGSPLDNDRSYVVKHQLAQIEDLKRSIQVQQLEAKLAHADSRKAVKLAERLKAAKQQRAVSEQAVRDALFFRRRNENRNVDPESDEEEVPVIEPSDEEEDFDAEGYIEWERANPRPQKTGSSSRPGWDEKALKWVERWGIDSIAGIDKKLEEWHEANAGGWIPREARDPAAFDHVEYNKWRIAHHRPDDRAGEAYKTWRKEYRSYLDKRWGMTTKQVKAAIAASEAAAAAAPKDAFAAIAEPLMGDDPSDPFSVEEDLLIYRVLLWNRRHHRKMPITLMYIATRLQRSEAQIKPRADMLKYQVSADADERSKDEFSSTHDDMVEEGIRAGETIKELAATSELSTDFIVHRIQTIYLHRQRSSDDVLGMFGRALSNDEDDPRGEDIWKRKVLADPAVHEADPDWEQLEEKYEHSVDAVQKAVRLDKLQQRYKQSEQQPLDARLNRALAAGRDTSAIDPSGERVKVIVLQRAEVRLMHAKIKAEHANKQLVYYKTGGYDFDKNTREVDAANKELAEAKAAFDAAAASVPARMDTTGARARMMNAALLW